MPDAVLLIAASLVPLGAVAIALATDGARPDDGADPDARGTDRDKGDSGSG